MLTFYAQTFKEGWKQFGGGEWATVVTPENGGTAYPIRPDGSLCEPRNLRRNERKTLESLQVFHEDLCVIGRAFDADRSHNGLT